MAVSVKTAGTTECEDKNTNKDMQTKIWKLDNYFCSLLNTIPPDIYFGKFLNETEDEQNSVSTERAGHGKQEKKSSKCEIFRRVTDGSMMTVTEVYNKDILKTHRKNQIGLKKKEGDKQVLLDKLHAKLNLTGGGSRKRKQLSNGENENRKRAKSEKNKTEQSSKKQKQKYDAKISDIPVGLETHTNMRVKKMIPSRKMTFSKFNVANSSLSDNVEAKKSKKKRQDLGTSGKKFDKLIKIAERKQKEIHDLKAVDPIKAKEKCSVLQWDSAVLKAQGVKVKDDVNLLKKAAKRREKQKDKSKRVWEKRKHDQVNRSEERQRKRKENIRQKKLEKQQRKKKKAAKKGRIFVDVNG